MSSVHYENKQMLSQVVEALPKWENRVLFIGGATLGFYLEEGLHSLLRTTLDVDLVIEVASLSKFYLLADELRKSGFVELPERISRWKYNGLLLDILPSGVGELQSSNPWIQEAFTRAVKQKLDGNIAILIPTLLDFIVLKLQAFEDRGKKDYLAKDMDDIVTVIDGYPAELLTGQSAISASMADYVASKLNEILVDSEFLNLLPGILPTSSLTRIHRFKARILQFLEFIER